MTDRQIDREGGSPGSRPFLLLRDARKLFQTVSSREGGIAADVGIRRPEGRFFMEPSSVDLGLPFRRSDFGDEAVRSSLTEERG